MEDILSMSRRNGAGCANSQLKADNLHVSREGAGLSRQGGPTAGTGFVSCAVDCLMDVSEVADYLRISRSMVYKLVESGKIPAIRIGRLLRASKNELLEFFSATFFCGPA